MAPLILVLLALPATQGSVAALRGTTLATVQRTQGRSHLGRDVHWHVPASVLARPLKVRRGWQLHRYRKVGILVNGRVLATLNGHLDLRRPLPPDYSLILGSIIVSAGSGSKAA